MVSPAALWPGLTKPGLGEPNEPSIYRPSGKVTFFRVVPADDLQGDVGVSRLEATSHLNLPLENEGIRNGDLA